MHTEQDTYIVKILAKLSLISIQESSRSWMSDSDTLLQSDFEILSVGDGSNAVECSKPSDIDIIDPGFGDGAFFNGLPTICQNTFCFSYSFEEAKWRKEYQLSITRFGLRAVAIDDVTGWVTGGRGLSSTDLIASGTVTPGPKLPLDVHLHCVVRVNATHIFIAGGRRNERSVPDAFIFDWPNQAWTQVADMIYPRDLHACALLSYPPRIMVLGGMDNSKYDHNTSEVFDLARESWSLGPDMPGGTTLFGMQAVEYKDTFLMLGGCNDVDHSDNVYEMDPDKL